jgi:phospholipid-translocating ATPase
MGFTNNMVRIYMADGMYQSVIVFFMTYLLFSPSTFNDESGRDINDSKRMGVYIASTAVVVVNVYILFNTYRWDWLMVLITSISILLIWFWTGVYTSFTAGFTFYKSAPQVYGALSFWALLLLTIIICLLPRFTAKAAQKMFFPRDVDIIREQIRQGKFDYLKDTDAFIPPPPEKVESLTSSESSQKKRRAADGQAMSEIDEDMRPIRAASLAASGTTHQRTQTGSDGTEYTGHHSWLGPLPPSRPSLDRIPSGQERPVRPSFERVQSCEHRSRPSFDRARMSMDRVRPSFEQSQDFTSAANLMRIESAGSGSMFPTWSRKRSSSRPRPSAEAERGC